MLHAWHRDTDFSNLKRDHSNAICRIKMCAVYWELKERWLMTIWEGVQEEVMPEKGVELGKMNKS